MQPLHLSNFIHICNKCCISLVVVVFFQYLYMFIFWNMMFLDIQHDVSGYRAWWQRPRLVSFVCIWQDYPFQRECMYRKKPQNCEKLFLDLQIFLEIKIPVTHSILNIKNIRSDRSLNQINRSTRSNIWWWKKIVTFRPTHQIKIISLKKNKNEVFKI